MQSTVNQVLETPSFQKAIDAVEALSLQDQVVLLNILSNRLKQRQSQQVVQEVKEVQQQYAEGKVKFGSVNDFLAELDS
jgi:L-asparaginase/Glu-tRNA(Gln) amidotransferase subunit D